MARIIELEPGDILVVHSRAGSMSMTREHAAHIAELLDVQMMVLMEEVDIEWPGVVAHRYAPGQMAWPKQPGR
jgi:hypothetical protein